MTTGSTSDLEVGSDDIRLAYAAVIERVRLACQRAARDPSSVTVVAVSKTVKLDRVRVAAQAGISTFGENRVQEAGPKILALPAATWHLVGPLQSNKARRAVELFDVIESVDSVDLARRLDRLAQDVGSDRQTRVLVQVNVDGDPAKTGFGIGSLDVAMPELLDLPGLAVEGLMTVGRLVPTAEEARPTFRALRELSEGLRNRDPRLGAELSMGMTEDFEVAVEEGATIVRVGRAIFGERRPLVR